MAEENLKRKIFSSSAWSFAERLTTQGVTFVVSLIIARILEPSDYGVIAIVSALISFLNVFATAGYGTALVQKKDSDDRDFNTVFTFSGLMALLLYAFLFFGAPWIAKLYDIPALTPLIRVMGLRLPVTAFNSVQRAYVTKRMEFRKFFWSTTIGTIVSAMVGVTMALSGCGIWALAGQYLTSTIIDAIVLYIVFEWKYKPYYSHKRAVPLFKFGSGVLLATLVDAIYQEARTLIVGKKYDTASLAVYNRGEQFPKLFVLNISSAIDGVLMPAFCQLQDDCAQLRNALKRSIQISSLLVMPLMVGLAVVAEPMIQVVLTEKWLEAVPYVQVFCLSYMFNPLQTASNQVIKALGKSKLYLILEMIKKTVFILSLVVAVQYGVFAIAVTAVVVSIVSCLINAGVMQKLIGYSVWRQLLDILPGFLAAIIMGIVVAVLPGLISNSFMLLVCQILVGGVVYVLLSYLFNRDVTRYLLNILKGK